MAKVLVADDRQESREALGKALAEWGYEVVSVESGFQAVRELLVDPEIRLALLDRHIPGMDGFKVCRVIRSLDRFVYAILLFAEDEPEDVARAVDAGASNCLGQPLDNDRLRALLEEGQRQLAPEGS